MTLLGVGVVSRLVVDAALEAADELRVPVLLVASRRQVDKYGGYVWDTESFARHVRLRSYRALLCRDHGGPWQDEKEASVSEAMASAKESLAEDMRCKFDVLHLDPSPGGELAMDLLVELCEFCEGQALEVGAEPQSGRVGDPEDVRQLLDALPVEPTFVVAQTGTLVKETRNVGEFTHPNPSLERRVRALVEAAGSVMVKEHNGDYLSWRALRLRPELGIGGVNVAPEFGVEQTRGLLELLRGAEEDEFLQLAYDSRKWEKWLLPNSKASDRDKAVIAGHYVFETGEFAGLYARLLERVPDAEERIKARVKGRIKWYLGALA